jgi:hypothetical protein
MFTHRTHHPIEPESRQLQIGYSFEKCRRDGGMMLIPGIHFPSRLQSREP